MARNLFFVWLLLLAAGCGEDPQRLDEARVAGHRSDDWSDQMRTRTLQHQNEAERIYR